MPYTGRLAPSPTGLLHLGHERTFWIAFERARAANGTLWLRDEDLDPQRSRPEFSAAMKEDLHWLGITWDREMRQSERIPHYRAALEQLIESGHAYPCTCSRKDLVQSTQAPHDDDDEPLYNNRCRPTSSKPLESAEKVWADRKSVPQRLKPDCDNESYGILRLRSGQAREPVPLTKQDFSRTLLRSFNYRFRVPDNETITFNDLHAGPQTFTAGVDFGDFLIWRKDNLPSYQLACVVDDAAMHITEVVRGRDLLKSTARQILLQRALGLPTPQYFHCNLLRDEQGVRLAKRHDALSLRALREQGLTPAQVRERFKL